MSNNDKYTLYDLVAKVDDPESQVSPFVFKTFCDLAILGLSVDEKKLTFTQIRSELVKATGNKTVTVPTLKVKEGEYITDSFDIAEWLDAHHGTSERSLFVNPTGLHFARFINIWSDTVLAPIFKPLWRPLFYTIQDRPSQEYFVQVKTPGGMEELSRDLDNLTDPAKVELMAAETRAVLQLLETYLEKSGGPFILGTKPSHCDSAIYGWYSTSQLNAKAVNPLIWEHPDLPRIKNWTRAITEFVGIKFDFKVPALK